MCPSTPPKSCDKGSTISTPPSWLIDDEIEEYTDSDYDYKDEQIV